MTTVSEILKAATAATMQYDHIHAATRGGDDLFSRIENAVEKMVLARMLERTGADAAGEIDRQFNVIIKSLHRVANYDSDTHAAARAQVSAVYLKDKKDELLGVIDSALGEEKSFWAKQFAPRADLPAATSTPPSRL